MKPLGKAASRIYPERYVNVILLFKDRTMRSIAEAITQGRFARD